MGDLGGDRNSLPSLVTLSLPDSRGIPPLRTERILGLDTRNAQGWGPPASLRIRPSSVLALGRLFLAGLALGKGTDVVDQVPVPVGFHALALGRHVLVSGLDEVEDFAVGAVFQSGRVAE